MRYEIHTLADGGVAAFARYAEATADARERSSRAEAAQTEYSVWDGCTGQCLNAFLGGEPQMRHHRDRCAERVRNATSSDAVMAAIRFYAEDLGVPELGDISLDEAHARLLEAGWTAAAEVFAAAEQRWEALRD